MEGQTFLHTETERKFLVTSDGFLREAVGCRSITQGYVCRKEKTVRVRLCDDKAYLTIKGKTKDGLSRQEWEIEIDPEAASSLFPLCSGFVVKKKRYLVPEKNGHCFEVDVFEDENEGLTVAEVELGSAEEPFERPSWLGEEVTTDSRYRNAYLSVQPYKTWNQE